VYKRDTEECNAGDAFCYQGSCRSHNDQCKVLWGPSGGSSDQCYEKNTNGSRHGNCGYDKIKQEYIPCPQQDAMCGMLQCRHLNERLEFGMESVAILSHSFMNYRGSIVPCRTAIIDLGLQSVDPGLTPDGAKCAADKMCVKQKCLAIQNLRLEGKILECPNCHGNGICNSRGHCHCDEGYGPPFCDGPGVGGSIDSGPASDPDSKSSNNLCQHFFNGFRFLFLGGRLLTKIMYILFIGVIPCCSLFALFIYYLRQNNFQILRKSPSLYVSTTTKNYSKQFASKNINKRSISSGMLLSSTNPTLLSKSTDLLNADRVRHV
jgi:hypothetical protein